MPVRCINASKRPRNISPTKSSLHMLVLCDIQWVVKINEAVTSCGVIHRQRSHGKQRRQLPTRHSELSNRDMRSNLVPPLRSMLHFSQSISSKFHSNVLRSSGLLAAGKLYVSLFSFIIRHASRHKASSL